MKKTFITIITFAGLLTNVSLAVAATSTPTPTTSKSAKTTPSPTPKDTTETNDQIEKIKDLVASKVAELKLVEKKGVVGSVKSKTNTEIIAIDTNNHELPIDIDELTKFDNGSDDKSFGISDIQNGDVMSFVGLFNKDTNRLLARFVTKATSIPINIEGAVLDKDDKEYTLDLVGSDGKKKLINIESSTKTVSYDGDTTDKSGFSKIEVGSRIMVVGFADPKVKDQINASRITYFVSLPASDEMKKYLTPDKTVTTPTP